MSDKEETKEQTGSKQKKEETIWDTNNETVRCTQSIELRKKEKVVQQWSIIMALLLMIK
jgi:hypothetical protein